MKLNHIFLPAPVLYISDLEYHEQGPYAGYITSIPHSAGGMSAKQYSVCMIPKISVGCAWFGLSNHICIRPQGDIGMQSNRALSESAKYVVLVRSKTQVSINEKKKEVFKMQEKKENLTMGNSRHTAMGEGAMPR